MVDFYLASASPRRAQLLSCLDYEFAKVPGEIDETPLEHESAQNYVLRMAIEKARAGQANAALPRPILGADTIICCDGDILGKPKNEDDCVQMLSRLSGRTHEVLTAVAVISGQTLRRTIVTTEVTMRTITTAEMIHYWASGEPADKAGSYAIQGNGGRFVQSIHGSYSSVVGLPLVESEALLASLL